MLFTGTANDLQAVLAAAVNSAQPKLHVDYEVYGSDGATLLNRGTYQGVTTDDTPVEMVAGQANAFIKVKNIAVFNADDAAATVTVQIKGASLTTVLMKRTLAAGDNLTWSEAAGWQITAAAAA